MKNPGTAIFLSFLFFSSFKAQKFEKLYQYVNPLIGTEKMGHTYPGATVPFGAVQLSPETDSLSYELNGKYNGDVYKYCDTQPEILISSFKDSKGLYLQFKDNGIGIPSKNIPHIFDKFYRITTKKSDEVTGFGLGLFYVKKVVQQHNWKISVENNPDKGITITLFSPF